ncbi:hypothetical protein [Heyndrickxia sporothermodurans]|uniref:hypothetical protein n=1 Tax=Heyndrickxia sporothermodurans TaxID=46224 RepID=UPI001F468C65|nr:hypothetical protein [Heyndrickxia sporothermodurans]MBL5768386.1 hypothetical protein [Heyndrickxia sporothermodurans]
MATRMSHPWYRKRVKRYDGNANLVAMVPEKREAVRWQRKSQSSPYYCVKVLTMFS